MTTEDIEAVSGRHDMTPASRRRDTAWVSLPG
jgi:hypothetical protein